MSDVKCEGNRAELDCPTCKGFKSGGICSHVLAINHILGQYDLGRAIKTISGGKGKGTRGGNRKSLPKALERLTNTATDSSDEEEEILRLLHGGQGEGSS